MIRETVYKDRPAIELSCDKFAAVFLPEDGAKLASFKTANGFEFLLQAPGEQYRRLDLDGDFEQSECSGFDDMFPTVDPCVVNGKDYLDHGEVCRRAHRVNCSGEKVEFCCEMPNLNILYKKTAYIKAGALFVEYRIENRNDHDFEYVWAGHIMTRGEEGMYAVSNVDDSPRDIISGTPVSGESAHVLPPKVHEHYKFYYTGANPPVTCGVVYPESGRALSVEFDSDVVKYFGAWVNAGDLNGMYTMASEPCTALYDDPIRAKQANVGSSIKAHSAVEFMLKMSYR